MTFLLYVRSFFSNCLLNTVWCCCDVVCLLPNTHKIHPIACLSGLGMWCILWVQTQIYTLFQSMQWCMQYHVFYCIIAVLVCNNLIKLDIMENVFRYFFSWHIHVCTHILIMTSRDVWHLIFYLPNCHISFSILVEPSKWYSLFYRYSLDSF